MGALSIYVPVLSNTIEGRDTGKVGSSSVLFPGTGSVSFPETVAVFK